MDQTQEKTLVIKAREGNRQALGELWDQITPKLFGYLVNVTKSKQLAEDLLQSTWLKAIEALPKYQLRGAPFSAWLFAIARNECRLHWRGANREEAFISAGAEVAGDDRDKIDSNLVIEQALSKLSDDDRELLRLRYIAGLPINDVARVLNINFVAARVRIHRALARARAVITS